MHFVQFWIMLAEGVMIASLLSLLFYARSRLGLSLLCIAIGVLQPIQVLLSMLVYVELFPGVRVSPGSVVLFTSSLFAVLLVYLREDALEVRKIVYGVVLANIAASLLFILFDLHARVGGVLPADLYRLSSRVLLSGTAALTIDVVLIIIVYEKLGALLRGMPFLRSYLALTLVLALDSVLFATGAFLGKPEFFDILISGLVGKTVFAVLYAAALTLYMRFAEPIWKAGPTGSDRPLRDVFYALSYREKYELHKADAERTLQQATERREAILEAAMDGIFAVDDSGQVVDANPASARTFGMARGELIGKSVSELIVSDDWNRDAVPRGQTSSSSLQYYLPRQEVVARHASGGEFPAEMTVTGAQLDGNEGYILSIRDVTARRRLEEERLEMSRMEGVGTLAAGIAHDFNNLLGVIIGACEAAARQDRDSEIETIEAAANRASRLTSQLLSFARKQVLSPEVVDLNALVDGVTEMLAALLGSSVKLSTRLAADLHPVRVSRDLFEQVILNLAANARDALNGHGEFCIETENCVIRGDRKLPNGDYVAIRCQDNGSGIPEKLLAQIFKPQFTTKAAGKGTGLGLAMCYGIVDQSHGKISASSDTDGTLFEILLPKAWEAWDLKPDSTRAIRIGWAAPLILVADDDPDMLGLVTAALRANRYRVLAARSGESALGVSRASAGDIDLVLTDVTMPDIRGDELARRIRSRWPSTPVLFMSGLGPDELSARGMTLPAEMLLRKPFKRAELIEKVSAIVDRPADTGQRAVAGS